MSHDTFSGESLAKLMLAERIEQFMMFVREKLPEDHLHRLFDWMVAEVMKQPIPLTHFNEFIERAVRDAAERLVEAYFRDHKAEVDGRLKRELEEPYGKLARTIDDRVTRIMRERVEEALKRVEAEVREQRILEPRR